MINYLALVLSPCILLVVMLGNKGNFLIMLVKDIEVLNLCDQALRARNLLFILGWRTLGTRIRFICLVKDRRLGLARGAETRLLLPVTHNLSDILAEA